MNLSEFPRKKKKVKEATGDPNFDSMLGKITGSDTPHAFDSNKAKKVQAMGENPTAETINALNKMMYDMHITMKTANELMQKLMSDQ